ncbi:phytanoyl-CoA dioxygenase family protein [Microbulbifer pacificus]|uniref:phytanoyl-CoA dioxygenase family protein n=1 Tax=Microbulbifer pacificus TaxID=407164 RepID=UPI000CF3776F|nr:phytanoyl-CoA dioxygenase family protein [Microbulbifer pacificus]
MTSSFSQTGYFRKKNFLGDDELRRLREVVDRFHESWKQENATFYKDKAINSAYLTGPMHLDEEDRTALFQFIGSSKLMNMVTAIMGDGATFMNTQLFFDPVNASQNNYWHRDPQYHLSVSEQQAALSGPNVIHFRIPLRDEPGLELVPGTHTRWDNCEELDVRLERNGRRNHEPLSSAIKVRLDAGDLLIFSANMIHRGLYGMNRLSLDILFCDPVEDLVQFVNEHCLPDENTLSTLEVPDAFSRAIDIKALRRENASQ